MNLITRSLAAAAILVVGSFAANAAPILYDVEFDGSGAGDPGTGSFSYDADTKVMTSFIWDFGSGRTGGVKDSEMLEIIFGELFGNFLFRLMTGDALGAFAARNSADLLGPFPATRVAFCSEGSNTNCGMPVGPATYSFIDGDDVYRGVVTVAPSAIPEPATLALFGAALAGLGAMQRKRRRA